jgi:hypothetical protein
MQGALSAGKISRLREGRTGVRGTAGPGDSGPARARGDGRPKGHTGRMGVRPRTTAGDSPQPISRPAYTPAAAVGIGFSGPP